jgi:hypothetical protein
MSSRTTADDLASSAAEKTHRQFRVVLADDHPDVRMAYKFVTRKAAPRSPARKRR